MNSTDYERIGRVHFHKDNIGAGFKYISSFEDSYDTIRIETPVQIDFVERGWLGDITYWATNGFDINDYKKRNLTSEPVCIKDALCIRVEVRSKLDSSVEWTYTFLKY
jgi:hypothetical protein